jgi:hypothetical protein
VDSLWHRQATQNTAHRWLRHAIARAAAINFRPGFPTGETPVKRPRRRAG